MNEIVKSMKFGKLHIEKNLISDILSYAKKYINMRNVTLYCQLSHVFNLTELSHVTFRHIESCFATVARTRNFLQLDFDLVRKILKSSQLHVTSELEVFYAAERWVNFNNGGRKELALSLLQTVRLPLLSDPALNRLLRETSTICSIHEGKNMVKSALKNNESISSFPPIRYCNENLFDIVFTEGENLLTLLDGNKLENRNRFATINKESSGCHEAVYLNGQVYIVTEDFDREDLSIKRYSSACESWENVADFDYRRYFCVCALVDSVYVLGDFRSNSCLKFDADSCQVTAVAGMNLRRSMAACAVFRGKVVVSGGYCGGYFENRQLFDENFSDTVEAYDHSADEWTRMPSMVKATYDHSMVAIRNNLYVIGLRCQMYNGFTNKFVVINGPPRHSNMWIGTKARAVSISNKIYVFRERKSTVVCYDVIKDEWQEEKCEVNGYIKGGCCIKLPQCY